MLRSLKTALVLLVGVLIGWLLLGWTLFPVRWVNADLPDLSPGAKATYLLVVSDSYALDGDLAKAQALVAPLDQEEAAELIAALIADRRARGAEVEAQRLELLAATLRLRPPGSGPAAGGPGLEGGPGLGVDALSRPEAVGAGELAEAPPLAPGQPAPDSAGAAPLPDPGPSGPDSAPAPQGSSAAAGASPPSASGQALEGLDSLEIDTAKLAVACGLGAGFLFFLALAAGVGLARRRRRAARPVEGDLYYPPAPRMASRSRPGNHFGTTYNLGDDGYDASFTLEGPQGEFLGECGVSQSEVLDSGMPARISAFEVWLFDQREVRTVTKLLMGPQAYHDAAVRNKLAPKGEAVLAEVGRVLILETGTRRCEAEVTQVQFADHNGARDAYFTRLTVELSVA